MSEARDRRRNEFLARSVSPLVHRLNNLLAIAAGQCDVWASRPIAADPRYRAELERIRASTAEMGVLLAALAEMSKDDVGEPEEAAELGSALQAVRALATPLANESGVALSLERIGGDAVLTAGRRRLERALQLATIAAVTALRDRRGRVRLRAYVGRGRVSLALTTSGSVDDSLRAEIANDLAALPRAGVRSRQTRGSTSWRAVFPAETKLDEPQHSTHRARRKVLLVEPDDLMADLIASVLTEEGYGVEVVRDLDAAFAHVEECEVMLLDSGVAIRSRARASELVAEMPRAAVLGESGGGLGLGLPVLAKPCGPDALVRAVGAL